MPNVSGFQVQGSTYDVNANLTFDSTPTSGSTNPVTSNGIYVAIQNMAIGSTVSYGRAESFPSGYCSIAYGTNVAAAGDYSIAIGKNHVVAGVTSVAVGDSNVIVPCGNSNAISQRLRNTSVGESNLVAGKNNRHCGYRSVILGSNNNSAYWLGSNTSYNEPTFGDRIYIGYIKPSNKHIYTIPDMTEGTEFIFSTTEEYPQTNNVYVLDLNTYAFHVCEKYADVDSGMTGLHQFKMRSKRQLLNQYVHITDVCHNTSYVYRGVCYYDSSTGLNYSDSAQTQILPSISNPEKLNVGDVYYDAINGNFMKYTRCDGRYSYVSGDWLPVNIYQGQLTSISSKLFIYGYVKIDNMDVGSLYHVYSSSEYTQDITMNLHDGEIVCDRTGLGLFSYHFNKDGVLSYVLSSTEPSEYSSWYTEDYFPHVAQSIIAGETQTILHGLGTTMCGYNNEIANSGDYIAMFGISNYFKIGGKHSNAHSLIAGKSNRVETPDPGAHCFGVIGEDNTLQFDTGDQCFVMGAQNRIVNDASDSRYITTVGQSNVTKESYATNIMGMRNNTYNLYESCITGFQNNIGNCTRAYSKLTLINGIWVGDGVSYNASTDRYTIDTSKIYMKFMIPDSVVTSIERASGGDLYENRFICYSFSTDGVTFIDKLATAQDFGPTHDSWVAVYGHNNTYDLRWDTNTPYRNRGMSNVIIGCNNTMTGNGAAGIGLFGYKLKYSRTGAMSGPTCNPSGCTIVGCYNEDADTGYPPGYVEGGIRRATFVVGCGSENSGTEYRKNGLVVTLDGIVNAPSFPSSLASAQQQATNSNYDFNKNLVTYELLKEYAPTTPGAIGKPGVTFVTLNSGDWAYNQQTSRDEQTISNVTDITQSSIIIAMPNGNPMAYYTHGIYVTANGTESITFACDTTPSDNISVKVVYWK